MCKGLNRCWSRIHDSDRRLWLKLEETKKLGLKILTLTKSRNWSRTLNFLSPSSVVNEQKPIFYSELAWVGNFFGDDEKVLKLLKFPTRNWHAGGNNLPPSRWTLPQLIDPTPFFCNRSDRGDGAQIEGILRSVMSICPRDRYLEERRQASGGRWYRRKKCVCPRANFPIIF